MESRTLVLVVLLGLCTVTAQEKPDERVDLELQLVDPQRPISAAISDLVHPWYSCRVETTTTILGYDPNSYRAVYARKCTGYCLSLIKAPHTCQPTYTYVTVSSNPYFAMGFPRSVRQVQSCNCKPRQCSVTDSAGVVRVYNHGATVIDNCNRKCTCSYGNLINCCRQRKEFRTMPTAERQRFIETYKYASQTLPYKTQFDALVLSHGSLFFSGIHMSAAFFPWHRYYILKLENLLQQIDCRVTVPYWDWALQAANPLGSVIWGAGASYLGGDGNGGCVTDGPFASPGWTQADGNCLTRNFANAATTATKPQIAAMISSNPLASDYMSFKNDVEGGVGTHDHVHCIILGTMCTTGSAQAPEFFLHHGFIDKIWHDWQMADPTHVNAYSGSTVAAMPGTATRPIDMFDLTAQVMDAVEPPVRVCYNEPVNFPWVDVLIDSIGIAQLNRFPRVKMSPMSPELFKMMRFNQDMIDKVRAAEAAANDARIRPIIDQKDAIANCTLLSSLGVFITDDQINRALSKSFIELGPDVEESEGACPIA